MSPLPWQGATALPAVGVIRRDVKSMKGKELAARVARAA
jgi:hypothetical protein